MPTKIEWTHIPGFKGETWNPVTGCIKVSPGCTHCYAETLTLRFKRGGPFMKGQTTITCHENRVNIPLHWRDPRCVFTCSMSDLFQDGVPDVFILRCLMNMAVMPQHLFLILTKRPERMAELLNKRHVAEMILSLDLPWPLPNVWLGTSVENQTWVDRRIPALLEAPAVIHFVSAEPLLREIDLSRYLNPFAHLDRATIAAVNQGLYAPAEVDALRQKTVKWVIVGGESGPGHRPMLVPWVAKIRTHCESLAVPFFLKQWGGARPGGEAILHGKEYRQWPVPANAPEPALFGKDDRP